MTGALIASLLCNLLLIVGASFLWKAIGEAIRRHDKIQQILLIKESQLMAEKVLRFTSPPPAKVPVFDQQTTSLLKLAVGNSNEHEARSAALQACKRIHKKLNG